MKTYKVEVLDNGDTYWYKYIYSTLEEYNDENYHRIGGPAVTEYYKDGKLKREAFYENGKLHGTELNYYPNGQLECEMPYKNGMLHGRVIDWYKNKKIKYSAIYQDGQRHGPTRGWHEKGRIKYESPYENGKLHGVVKRWYEDGDVCSKITYQYDQRHGIAEEYGEERYYWCDQEVSKEEFEKQSNNICEGKIVTVDGKKYKLKLIQ